MSGTYNNSLNNSKSKQLYSFPRSPRFTNTLRKDVIDAFYEHDAKNTQKSFSFAKSQRLKTEDYVNKNSSNQFLYEVEGEIERRLKNKSGVKILYGRQECKSKGIFCVSDTPGPGRYNPNPEKTKVRISSQCSIGNSMRNNMANSQPNPGPGAYKVQSSLLNDDKILSKDQKRAVGRILFEDTKPTRIKTQSNPEIRFPEINNKGEQTFQKGRGFLIGKSQRFLTKINKEEPGPGQYKVYSQFLQGPNK